MFYLVVNIDISRDDLKKLLNGLKIVMVVQGIIGSLQYFLPASFNQAFFAYQIRLIVSLTVAL